MDLKRNSYVYTFKGGDIEVHACNEEEGKILAQAEAIKKAWDYKVIGFRVV